MAIRLKRPDEIEKMRAACQIVRKVHELCREMCRPGVTTKEIDQAAGLYIEELGATGTFKNFPTYRPNEGFPSNLCISVNDVVVHGIAGETVIQPGDLVGIDCGVTCNGWCGDAAVTLMVGDVDDAGRKLCCVTEEILQIAIENIRPGRRWSSIARLMQDHAEQHGYGVVREFVGHGIGQRMHEEPKLPNYVSRELLRDDIVLREGMVMAIEPMCNMGTREVKTLNDGWTIVTADGKPSAHFEHTVAVTRDGADILTEGR